LSGYSSVHWPPTCGERIDDVRAYAEQPQLEDLKESHGSGADDDRFHGRNCSRMGSPARGAEFRVHSRNDSLGNCRPGAAKAYLYTAPLRKFRRRCAK
jgi:hypothetical protein